MELQLYGCKLTLHVIGFTSRCDQRIRLVKHEIRLDRDTLTLNGIIITVLLMVSSTASSLFLMRFSLLVMSEYPYCLIFLECNYYYSWHEFVYLITLLKAWNFTSFTSCSVYLLYLSMISC